MPDLAPATASLAAVKRGDTTAQAIASAALDRLRTQALPTNSFISLCEPDDVPIGNDLPLAGATFGLKDNINVRGARTTCGSQILRDVVATDDADIVRAIKQAGGVCVGKNNMHEFALGATNLNPHYGDVTNPWDFTRIAGGSSGGSGTAVATGEVDFAIGTDSGGSVRIPAAFCGVVGFKPTGASVNLSGIAGAAWTIDNIGIFARSVRDTQVLWEQVGPADKAPSPSGARLRLAYLQDDSMGMVAPEVWSVYTAGIESLKRSGHDLTGISLHGFERAPFACVSIAYPEVSAWHRTWIRERSEEYGADIRPLIQLGELLGARHYVIAQRARAALLQAYARQTGGFDAVLMPTAAVAPPKRGEPASVPGDPTKHTLFTLMRFTVLFNVIGYPALSLPLGLDRAALPVGLQVVGRPGADAALLSIASGFEGDLEPIGAPPVHIVAP